MINDISGIDHQMVVSGTVVRLILRVNGMKQKQCPLPVLPEPIALKIIPFMIFRDYDVKHDISRANFVVALG